MYLGRKVRMRQHVLISENSSYVDAFACKHIVHVLVYVYHFAYSRTARRITVRRSEKAMKLFRCVDDVSLFVHPLNTQQLASCASTLVLVQKFRWKFTLFALVMSIYNNFVGVHISIFPFGN